MLQGEHLHPKEHKKLIFTDASNTGWGAHSGQNSTGGLWSLSEKHLHINLLEMKAVLLALQFFKTDCSNNQVLIASDNTSVVAYINQQGGTKSAELCALTWRILTWCHLNNVTLRARHVPGSLNVIADGLSRRNQIQSTEWPLSPQIFKQISKLWESPQVDLFATSLNKKTSYICLSDSGSSGMGSRCPQHSVGKHGCLRVPSHHPAAQGCTKTSITNMQDNSDSPRLADKTMVLGPGGGVSGHSKTTTTHTYSAKTTTEQPIPCQPNIPEPPRLVSRSLALQKHGFTAEVAERIAVPQRLSTRSIYTSKWTVFQRWCTEKQVDFRSPSIGDICNFFWYLFNDLNRCPSTIEGYRTAIADTLGNTKQNISTNPEIARLIASFHRDKPKRLTQPPFEPQEEAALKFLTWKTVFLLALASGKRRSEIHGWTLDGLLCLGDWDQIQLSPSPSFIAKNQLAKEGPQSISPVVVPALKCSQDSPDTDVLLCTVRALQCYLDRTNDSRGGRQLLFISYKLGHSKDIQCSTISSWIKNTIKFCYTKVDNADMDLVGVKAHDVRAFAASKAFYGGISMDQIIQACHWKSHNTFTRFYLRDLAGQDQSEGCFHLGAFIAAQQVMPPSDQVPGKKKEGGTMPGTT